MPHDANSPQLRTLLLTDLCDSTGLVERLGDGVAASLFRDHDRLVLELQQRWRGRLIDRSDGLLLLFERPLDGLGFALDYRLGLDALGRAHRIGPILARAGLHVGEVLIWRNSQEAVNAGAKPVEVEGLAKPFAARLMHLARPGQILLSSVAEPLLRRSVSELGERGDALQWRTHGRWLFKGVPKSQEVHEVGEPGLAPLRAPRGDAKARRDVPAWRHPLALAAEAAAVVGLVVGGWFMTRPEPAIAFAERDWVVVGDLRNLTGDHGYEGAVESALRTSLEQSQFVNVVADTKVRGILTLMRQPGAPVDRHRGVEIAQRVGARMLLLPTVSEVGGKVRVDLDVVDPSTTETVLSLGASGQGIDSAIPSTGELAGSLRARLGESTAVVARSSLPLEQVTTSSVEALRAFTLAQRAYAVHDMPAAEQHFLQALQIDPEFAMAKIGLARVAYGRTDVAKAQREMIGALENSRRLTDRERLYADAQLALIRWDKGYLDKWIALSNLYPDFDVAAFNAASGLWDGNRYSEMRAFLDRAIAAKGVTLPMALTHRAVANSALGEYKAANEDCENAARNGFTGSVDCALIVAANGDTDAALAQLRPVQREPAFAAVERATAEMSVLVDAGRLSEAEEKARNLIDAIPAPQMPFDWMARSSALAVLARRVERDEVRGQAEILLHLAEKALPAAAGRQRDAIAMTALYAGYVAAGTGDRALAEKSQAIAKDAIEQSPDVLLGNVSAIITARLHMLSGDRKAARDALSRFNGVGASQLTKVELAHVAGTTFDDAGLSSDAGSDLGGRGRVYAEWSPERPPIIDVLSR